MEKRSNASNDAHDPSPLSTGKERIRFMAKLAIALLIVALGIAIANTAIAQELSVAAFGGVNSATVDFSEPQEFDLSRNVGLNVGGAVALQIADRFAVELAGMYTQKGIGLSSVGIEGSFNVYYLEFPLLAKVNLPIHGGSRTSFHLFAGPTVAFELSCQLAAEQDGEKLVMDCNDPEVGANTRSTDYGILFGGGFGIGAGPGEISLDVAYDLGLRNLNAEDPDQASVRNRTFMVSAGYAIPVARLW